MEYARQCGFSRFNMATQNRNCKPLYLVESDGAIDNTVAEAQMEVQLLQ